VNNKDEMLLAVLAVNNAVYIALC